MTDHVQEETLTKQPNLITRTLRAVRGDDTQQLIEAFTSEMTLVAEGLCDDQTRLKKDVAAVRQEQEHLSQLMDSLNDAQDASLREAQRDMDKRTDELSRRVAALENEAKKKPEKKPRDGLIRQLTVLVAIAAGAWVLVTILNLFKP